MDIIGDFIIGFFGEALASSPTLQRIFLWILSLYPHFSCLSPS